MKRYIDIENRFAEIFDSKTGFYARSGVFENGKETEDDPFMRSFPALIDVGIMGSCKHGALGLCAKAGIECYQSGSKIKEPDMTLEDYKSIIDQCNGKVWQIAAGGRGDPNLHKDFEEIMRYTREKGIVPNYTTSGISLTDEHIRITKEYAGAVAVSWYDKMPSGYTYSAINRFLEAGVTTNLHYVLSNSSIEEATFRLKSSCLPLVNAVVFLIHKPVGIGSHENVLRADDPRVAEFFSVVDSENHPYQIGFDSCTVPGILNFTKNIDLRSVDTCEGGRYSAYITPDMKMLPCSFDQELQWAVDLKKHTIEEAWNSEQFDSFREHFAVNCPDCSLHKECMSGCPIKNEIVLCNRKERLVI